MKTALFIIALLAITTCAHAQRLQFNALENRYEYAPNNAQPRLNPLSGEYELSTQDEQLQYNGLEDRYEYAPSGSIPRYNPLDDCYELAPADPFSGYNPFDE